MSASHTTLFILYSDISSTIASYHIHYLPLLFSLLRKFITSNILFSPLFHAKFITRRSDKTWCYQHYYYREEEWWSLKSDTSTVRLVRDNKNIKTIKTQEHHNNQVTQAIRDASLDYYSISRPLQTDKRRVHKLHYIDTAFIKYQSNVPQLTV